MRNGDQGWIETDDPAGTGYYDDDQARDDWDDIVEHFRASVLRHYPSTWAADKWIGRENRVVAMNAHACFGLSEYCGCIAYWVVLRKDIPMGEEGLAQGWFNQIETKFEQRFATLTRLGTFSNGEAIYQRIGA